MLRTVLRGRAAGETVEHIQPEPDGAGFTMSYARSCYGHQGEPHGGRRCTLVDRIDEAKSGDAGCPGHEYRVRP